MTSREVMSFGPNQPITSCASSSQPFCWNSVKYRHCLKSTFPVVKHGTQVNLHKSIRVDLLPSLRKLTFARWAGESADQIRTVEEAIRAEESYRAQALDILRLQRFRPGNFSTLFKPPKKKVEMMVDRLYNSKHSSKDSFEAEQTPLSSLPPISKAELEKLIERLTKKRPADKSQEKPHKVSSAKTSSEPLSAKALEIVERLTTFDKTKWPAESKLVPVEEEVCLGPTVSGAELQAILDRLCYYDPEKWPPESMKSVAKKGLQGTSRAGSRTSRETSGSVRLSRTGARSTSARLDMIEDLPGAS